MKSWDTNEKLKQIPLEVLHPESTHENEDNQLRKYIHKKQQISQALKQYKERKQDDKNIHTTRHHIFEKVLTGVAIDSNGNPLKRKKVKIEQLPSENPAPNLKLQSTKRQKVKWITKDDYYEMVKQKNQNDEELIKKTVLQSMNIKEGDLEHDETIKHTYQQLVTRRRKEMINDRKPSSDRLSNFKSTLDSAINEGEDKENEDENLIDDIYNIEEIYKRDLMTSQHRRFGSPDFIVKNDSMMCQPPTNFLDSVKPGVELIGGTKPLKGPKFNENPYFDCEEEIESDEISGDDRKEIEKEIPYSTLSSPPFV